MGMTMTRNHHHRTIEVSCESYLKKFSRRFFEAEPEQINTPNTPQIPGGAGISEGGCTIHGGRKSAQTEAAMYK